MENDITRKIADLVHKANPGLDQLQAERCATLRQVRCLDRSCGRWIEIGVEFVVSVFKLRDRDFAVRFPELSNLSSADRRRFLKKITDHLKVCRHCAVAHAHDLELHACIEQVMQKNRTLLLQDLTAPRS